MHIGAILKKTREAHGISQRAFARVIGVSSGYVSLLEAGKRTPSLDYLEAFAALFNTRVWVLLLAAEAEAVGWPVTVGAKAPEAM